VAGVAGVQAQLAENGVDVLAHRAVGDDERRADLGVRVALGHEGKHVPLPLGQRFQGIRPPAHEELGDDLRV
jgi:hypothetical protein